MNNSLITDLIYIGTKHCCVLPLDRLIPTLLCEMEVPKVHFGKFLVGRTLIGGINSDGLFGTTTLFEDINGDVEEITFYYFSRRIMSEKANWIPKSTIFIVNEPFLKYGLQGNVFVRVDSPSAVEFICETDQQRLKAVGAMKW